MKADGVCFVFGIDCTIKWKTREKRVFLTLLNLLAEFSE